MSNPLSKLFIDSTWEQFRVAYYDAPNDYVYYCLWTDLTELDPNKNWFVVFNDFRPQALQYFIDNKLFTIEVDKKPDEIKTPIPKFKGDKTCEIAGETTKPMTRPSSEDILLNDRKTIDPRPNGVVRLLYRIEDASTKLNVEKIQVEYNKFTQQRQQKPLSKQIKDFIDDGKKKDFKINNISDIAKIANIRDLKDLNDFLKARAQESNYVSAKIGQSLGQTASGVNLDLAQAVRDNAEPPVITRNQVYSQTLRDAEYLGDFAFFNFPAALSNVAEGTESFAGADNESVKALKDTLKKVNSELGKVYLMLNKWGLKPLIECLTALLIENLKAQGYFSLARALTEQLEELTKNYKSFGVEFDKYENFYNQIQKLWKNKSSSKPMGTVTKELKKQLDSLLLELGRQFVNTLVQQCLLLLASNEPEGDFDYGSVQPQDLFEDPIAFQNTAATSLGKEFTGNDAASFQNFINLTFSSLTGKEICRLLEGQAEPLLLLQLQSFAEQTKVDTFFDDLYAYANFFYQLGLQSGTAFCKVVNETEPNVNPTADYCDTKTDDPTAAKVPAGYGDPDVPQITVDDLANLLSEDAINNLLPDIDFSGLLNEAYRQAQEALYQYEINFNDDIANINKGLTKIQQDPDLTAALKDIGIEPPPKKNVDPIDFKTGLNLTKVKPDNIPELSIATDLIDNGNRLGNRVRFSGGQFSSIIIEGDGSYKIETGYNLPNKGVTTNNGKSPLAILGESIEGQDSTDPVERTYSKDKFGGELKPPKTTLDVYKSILKDVFNEFLTNFNNSIKNKTVLDVVSFYRESRRKRVNDELCEYSENREQSVAYSTDPSKEASIEALRIFVYTQMIELYPNFTSALLILPEEQATALIGATKNLVVEISKQIQTAAENYSVEIPVRNILCEAGLTVQDLVEQEIKLLSEASSPATKDTLSISEILKKKIKNTATPSTNAPFEVKNDNGIYRWYLAFFKAYTAFIKKTNPQFSGQIIKLETVEAGLKTIIDNAFPSDAPKEKIKSFLFDQATVTFKSLDDYARFVVFVVKTLRIYEDDLKVKVSNVDFYKDFFTTTTSGNFETTFEYDNIILAKDTGSFAGQANISDEVIKYYVDNPTDKVQKDPFTDALETDKGINIFDAFKEDFFNDILLNLIVEKSFVPSNKKFFFTLKPAIMRRFTGGVQPLGVDLEDARDAFKDFEKAQNPNLKELSISLWLLLLIMIPKMVIEAVKALLLSIVYAANPGIYFLIMLAQSLGLKFPDDFFEWLKKKTKEEILSALDPESPEAKKLQAEIAEIDPDKLAILDLKCDT